MFVLGILTEEARKQYYQLYKLYELEHYQGGYATTRYYVTAVLHPGLQGWLAFDKEHTLCLLCQIRSSECIVLSSRSSCLIFYNRRRSISESLQIIAYENDIERLNVSIEERTRLLEENNLNDQQVKQLADDVGTRFLSNIFLRQLKNEQARRLAQQQQQQQ
ncbi:unnamed protein product [Rotaria magnacalcarata]|uniref:Uncharacterized protein n=1 Tax=Rotaria magnacalcarata TaxID=392030 RepID=A0A820BGA9_9BILA|nr:unnamed protein product [Rotaria magnacalcarata]CAF4200976.1 unnamed protein product [Rotaria magnacalcarata]